MEIHQHSEMCECDVVHTDVVAHVREVMEDTEVLYAVSDFFKVMSDSTRMRIMAALDKAGEQSDVCRSHELRISEELLECIKEQCHQSECNKLIRDIIDENDGRDS